MKTVNFKLSLLLALFVGLLVGMNLLGGKVVPFLGLGASVGIFMVPVTFLITDIVAEVYGRRVATQFVLGGIVTLVVVLLYTALFLVLPPHDRFPFNDEYLTIFGGSARIMVASITGFALSQFHDVWAFEFWKKKTGGRFLWLRNNLSTMVSQLIDTLVFMMIAFYQVTPAYTFEFIIGLAIPYYLLKIGFSLIDTPFVYLGVRWLRGK